LYVTGSFLPPQYQFASGRIVYERVVFVASAFETRSLKYTPFSLRLKAPCCASNPPMYEPAS
jgi:hypothetical protein